MSLANGRLDRLAGLPPAGGFGALITWPNLLLGGCVVVAVWLVFVPIWALLYNAFTEDTSFGPGAFSLDNFVEAYSSWHILRLFRNSLIFAAATAVTTFVMGALVAWVVERTDAPGGSLFHSLSLLSFAVPGLLMAMAWIFVFSPEHRLGQRPAQIDVRAHRGAGRYLHDGRDDLGAVEPLFPARLSGTRAGAARSRRAHGGGRARIRRALPAGVRPHHLAAAAAGDPLGATVAVRDGHGLLRGTAADRPARAHRRVHHRHPGRHHLDAAAVRRGKRAQPDLAGDLRARRIFLSARHAPRRGVRDHHRQRATCRRASSSDLGVGRRRSASASCSCSRSGCRCSR